MQTDPPRTGRERDTELELLELSALIDHLTPEQIEELVEGLPHQLVDELLALISRTDRTVPNDPAAQARELDDGYTMRAHLTYLSERLAGAVRDVEGGRSRYLVISMPPRMGKSQLTSVSLPTWLLRKHPSWKIGLISHTPTLAVFWGRQVRRLIEEHPQLGITIARDAGAASDWQTTGGGGITSRSAPGQSITGLGFKVLLIDDIVKDYASAHSATQREAIWDWWKANSLTRLEPPALVVVVGTRWHEDDFIGRLLSTEYEGDPADWEEIKFPAIAEDTDVLGRAEGDPLYSPIIEEDRSQALQRWDELRISIGSYAFAGLYQQRPAPAQGAIFNAGWWRFWTTDPKRATDDGRVRYLDPERDLGHERWLDSWDCAFKGSDEGDYVVGQRWSRKGASRYLITQQRGHWSFTQTLDRMRSWAEPDGSIGAGLTHERLVEDKANGTAVIDTLKDQVPGLIPINPTNSKEARARSVTPEVEAGNVYLPHPSDPGNEWVTDLLSELRNFPHDAHDDQVDSLTQALSRLRDSGKGMVTNPGGDRRTPRQLIVNRIDAAHTDLGRPRRSGATPAGYRRQVPGR